MFLIRILLAFSLFVSSVVCAQQTLPRDAKLTVNLTLPAIVSSEYHRPYTAIWLESRADKRKIPMALWVEEDDWFKDLRSWWRSIGRRQVAQIDAYSSATRGPGKYRVVFSAEQGNAQPLVSGDYQLHVEVVREGGGRSYLRQNIRLQDTAVTLEVAAEQAKEIEALSINYQPGKE